MAVLDQFAKRRFHLGKYQDRERGKKKITKLPKGLKA